jgi:hypothetical protein
MRSYKRQVKCGKITEELFASVVYSLNRTAKKENCAHSMELYDMKTNLLKQFIHPSEIHLLNGKEYLYYEVTCYKFHVPHELLDYEYKNLNVFIMSRENPTRPNKMSCLSLEFCKYFYNNKERLCLAC